MQRAALCVIATFSWGSLAGACKPSPEIDPLPTQLEYFNQACATETQGLRQITSIAMATMTLYISKGDACGSKSKKAFGLADAGSYKGVMIVDGVYGTHPRDAGVKSDIGLAASVYERRGWLVVDTANLSPTEAKAKVEAARQAHPPLFTKESPVHLIQVAHGEKNPQGGLILGATDENGTVRRYHAEERVSSRLDGAGDSVQVDFFGSSCNASAICPEKVGHKIQIKSRTTSSGADESSSTTLGTERALRGLLIAQMDPIRKDANKDGFVTAEEALAGETRTDFVIINSVYLPDGDKKEWFHTTPYGQTKGADYALPGDGFEVAYRDDQVRRDESGQSIFKQVVAYPQNPEMSDPNAIVARVEPSDYAAWASQGAATGVGNATHTADAHEAFASSGDESPDFVVAAGAEP